MTTPNLSVCPHCGREDFALVSLERVEAAAVINLEGELATGFTAHWDGETRVHWDSSATLSYQCGDCGEVLPEEYATTLDRLLNNTRENPEVGDA